MTLSPEFCNSDTLDAQISTHNTHLGHAALPCDAWHHHYHYQSSAQYLWLAITLRMLGREEEAGSALERSIFQDHFNAEALEAKKNAARTAVPNYDKHPLLDEPFLKSIGKQSLAQTSNHDRAASAFAERDYEKGCSLLDKAIGSGPPHSNSFFLRGKCRFMQGQYGLAQEDFSEAIRLSHMEHDAYHRAASEEHFKRGLDYYSREELDLAVSDFTKALDLHRGNKKALEARANAYRAKGNVQLAEADERLLGNL